MRKLALAVVLGVLVAAVSSSGAQQVTRQNGRIVFAAEFPDITRVAAVAVRSGRLSAVSKVYGESPAPSPDGSWVAFSRSTEAGTSIWLVHPDGTHRHRLSAGTQPAWSPNSRRITFVDGDPSTYPGNEVDVIDRDGRHRRTIISGEWVATPIWSPTGRWIAFQRGSDLWVVRPNGSGAHEVAAGVTSLYSWSPNGSRLVFTRSENVAGFLRPDLYTVSVAGSDEQRLTNDREIEYDPQWEPKGGRIAYTRVPVSGDEGWSVAIVPASGGPARRIRDAWNPVWSPSGGRLSFFTSERGSAGLAVARKDGSGRRTVLRSPGIDFVGRQAWAPNGKAILVAERLYDARSNVFSVGSTGKPRRLTRAGTPAVDPAVSPSGRLVAFARVRPRGNREIWLMHRDGTRLRRLTNGWDAQPAWSPDGRRLAFVRRTADDNRLCVVSAVGGRPRRLAPIPRPANPAWSPNGRVIAVNGVAPEPSGIRLLRLDTGMVEELTHPPYERDRMPAWSPDGRQLAFIRFPTFCGSVCGPPVVWVHDLSTGQEHRVTWRAGTDERFRAYDVAWSPDGRRLAVAGFDGGPYVYAPLEVVTMNPDGSGRRVAWIAAGQSWIYGLDWAPK